MTRFIMIMGLPASGKSTLASSFENYIHISSDAIREELLGSEEDQSNNNLVFETMRSRTINALKNGKNVVYDATNTSSKKRKAFLKQLPKNVEKECIYVATNFYDCLDRDSKRERSVGREVILKVFRNLQIPMIHEGWDKINIHKEEKEYSFKLPYKINELSPDYYRHILMKNKMLRGNVDLAQDSSYHSLSVHRHMYATFEEVQKYSNNSMVLLASLFHDVGKYWTKSFKEGSRYANFYGHENVSAQLALAILFDIGIDKDSAIYIATLIQLHTRIMQITNQSPYGERLEKLKDEIGTDLFKKLMDLHLADTSAK